MTRREAERLTHQENTLLSLGFTREEAEALRRISMTLQRWFEKECGDSNDYASFAIERDETTEIPFMVIHSHRGDGRTTRYRVPDRETGARKRLERIVTACCTRVGVPLRYHIQTDPRGAALYIIRPGDVPAGGDVSSYYSRGVVVY